MCKTIAVIPAYKPGSKLPELLEALPQAGSSGQAHGGFDGILIVDDGSGEEYAPVFQRAEALGCRVVGHDRNMGKGAAIRSGLREAVLQFGREICVVTADADGQHLPKDILRVAEEVRRENGLPQEQKSPALVLGVRDLSASGVPFRSRIGNRLMRMLFFFSTGIRCRDTQTGLRGIPSALLPLALETEGDRYEYEMNFLRAAAGKARLLQIPIETVYEEGNAGSHFRPIRDSILFYQKPLRFMASAVGSNAVDWALFLLFLRFFGVSAFSSARGTASPRVTASTVLARIGSGLFNFEVNRRWSFRTRGRTGEQAARYLVLFFANMFCSAGAVTGLAALGLPAAAGKAAADVTLFIANYQLQKRWVFRKEAAGLYTGSEPESDDQ